MEILDEKTKRHVAGRGIESQKHVLASAWVMKASELGGGGREYHCRTHLGHLLHPGDSVLGLDIAGANMNNTYVLLNNCYLAPYSMTTNCKNC